MNIILASASPRRKELLAQTGYDFTVEVSEAMETVIPGSPGEIVEHLSKVKAEAVARNHMGNGDGDEEEMIIGADTIVVMDGEILGKPRDEEDARRMLHELSGRTHQVYTGVTLICLAKGKVTNHISFSECTDVTMRDLSEEEISTYIASGEPADKSLWHPGQGSYFYLRHPW